MFPRIVLFFFPFMRKTLFILFSPLQEGLKFVHDESLLLNLENTLDRWILSFTQSLVLFVKQEMAGKFRSINTDESVMYMYVMVNVVVPLRRGWDDSSFKPLGIFGGIK